MIKRLSVLLLISTLSLCAEDKTAENNQKSFGIEINPLSITILGSGSTNKGFSGAVSRFNNATATELALSMVYLKEEDNLLGDGLFYYTHPTKVMNIALHYRKFVAKKTNGFYYGGFTSYTYLDGKLRDDVRLATVQKFGIGAEIGLRLMKPYSDWSFYWGPALRVGKYFGSNNDIFENDSLAMDVYDKDYFFDVDVFRVGFRF